MPEPEETLQPTSPRSRVVLFISGVTTFGFVVWLGWAATRLIEVGVPEADRAGLVSTIVLAATGVVISAAVSVRNIGDNPLGFLADLWTSIAAMVRR